MDAAGGNRGGTHRDHRQHQGEGTGPATSSTPARTSPKQGAGALSERRGGVGRCQLRRAGGQVRKQRSAHGPVRAEQDRSSVKAIQGNDLVAAHAGFFINGVRVHAMQIGVGFAADHKEGWRLVQGIQPCKIQIAAIHHVDRSWLRH